MLPLLLDIRDFHLQQHTGTGGDKHPWRGIRGRSYLTATLGDWPAASRADKDAAPYLNIIREMAKLIPPPRPHPGCATPHQPRPQNPHPCEEHPWGIKASCIGELDEGRKSAFGDGNAKPPTHGHRLPKDLVTVESPEHQQCDKALVSTGEDKIRTKPRTFCQM